MRFRRPFLFTQPSSLSLSMLTKPDFDKTCLLTCRHLLRTSVTFCRKKARACTLTDAVESLGSLKLAKDTHEEKRIPQLGPQSEMRSLWVARLGLGTQSRRPHITCPRFPKAPSGLITRDVAARHLPSWEKLAAPYEKEGTILVANVQVHKSQEYKYK